MPIEDLSPGPAFRLPMGVDPAPERPVPLSETINAAFRQENLIASALDGLRPSFKSEPDHDPLDLISGSKYETHYLDKFVGSRSADETKFIMSRIDREEMDRESIAAGGIVGVAAAAAAGILDPTVLFPMGTVLKSAKAATSAVRSAVATAAVSGSVVAAQEAGLQATQEIRTPFESAAAIASSTLLGGILGGAAGVLGKKEAAALTKKLDEIRAGMQGDPDHIRLDPSVGAASAREVGTGELESAFGAEKVLAGISPVTRLQTSASQVARDVVRNISDAGLELKENKLGVPTSLGGTVENRVKMWSGGLGDAISTMDDAFARYWYGAPKVAGRLRARVSSEYARWSGNTGGRLTAKQFREEVGRAMVRGDEHQIPEVAEVAKAMRAKVLDPLKDAAIKAGLLAEDVQAPGAISYLTRVYNRQKIIAEKNRFRDVLFTWFRRQSDNADVEDVEVYDAVDGVIEHILGHGPFRLPGLDIAQGPRGPLKERVLKIPDQMIEDFLERDVEVVARLYTRTMAADVELANKFGDVTMKEQFDKLNSDYVKLINEAEDPASRAKLEKQRDRDIKDLEALRDRVRGVYALPNDIDGLPYRAGKIAQQINYLRLLGGMTISAVPDLMRPVMVYGLANTLRDGWLPMIREFKAARLAAKEVKMAGTALDMVLDTRSRSIADLFDDWQRGSKLERGIEGLTSRFGLVSIMAPWNAAAKQMVGTMAMHQILRAAKAVAEGGATQKQIRNLASEGIDENLARRIWGQFQNNGGVTERGLMLPNTEDWVDRKAIEAFRVAIVREADRVIVTPGLELPRWISTPLGKVLGQFKSFVLASTQRTLLAGLQQKDANFLVGSLGMLALGGLSTWLRAQTSGFDTSNWTETKWATEAVDRSGLLTIFSEANNIAEKVSRGRVGLSAFTGEMASRYQSRNAIGAVLGPSFDLATEMIGTTGSAFAGDWAASDTRAVRKILPYQNVFYLRRLLDEVEKGTNEALGVPQKKKN